MAISPQIPEPEDGETYYVVVVEPTDPTPKRWHDYRCGTFGPYGRLRDARGRKTRSGGTAVRAVIRKATITLGEEVE